MTSTLQTILVTAFVALSVLYLARRVWRVLRHADDPCWGCEGCALKEMKNRQKSSKGKNPPCGDKKRPKKFGNVKQ